MHGCLPQIALVYEHIARYPLFGKMKVIALDFVQTTRCYLQQSLPCVLHCSKSSDALGDLEDKTQSLDQIGNNKGADLDGRPNAVHIL